MVIFHKNYFSVYVTTYRNEPIKIKCLVTRNIILSREIYLSPQKEHIDKRSPHKKRHSFTLRFYTFISKSIWQFQNILKIFITFSEKKLQLMWHLPNLRAKKI